MQDKGSRGEEDRTRVFSDGADARDEEERRGDGEEELSELHDES